MSRALPVDQTEKARAKRLARLLRHPALDGTVLTPLLVRLALGDRPAGWIPIVVDQTTIRGTEVLMAGVRVAHRVLPVAFVCFEYATIRTSQNVLEQSLLQACLLRACQRLGGGKRLHPSDKTRSSVLRLATSSVRFSAKARDEASRNLLGCLLRDVIARLEHSTSCIRPVVWLEHLREGLRD